MKLLVALLVPALLFATPADSGAADSQSPAQHLMSKLSWRSIGPFIGGRVVAVAGVPGNDNLFYMGGVQGGIWRSTDYGESWENISDGKLPGVADPIGALAVAASNPKIIYAGTGEADIRGDFDTGDGVYKTTDAGKTWSYAGLRDTRMIAKLAVDPHNPNVVYAASMGHVFRPNAERGIFKTTNGGASWQTVLFVDDRTGGIDLVMDPRDPNVLYAAMWQAQRVPWKLTSGGSGSGLYKTVDAGAHWKKLSANPGFARGILGKIGVSVSGANSRIVYAIVQARDGGVYRSTDGGATWKHVNSQMKLRQRAFYYTAIFADPKNPLVAYAPEVDGIYKTTNGGKTFSALDLTHGDDHILWVNPHNTQILLEGDDGGGTVSVDGGKTWSTELDQPTGQFYHVSIDDQFPFHVFGAQQDEGAFELPSAALGGGIGQSDWHTVALGESTFVAPEPGSPFVTYGSGYYSTFGRLDRETGNEQNVSPWPRYMTGASSAETKYRFGWTHPIFFSPADPRELLVAAQVVFSSLDHGKTWSILSPDLTRNDPSTEGPSGGPVDYDQTGAETFPDISALAASPLDANLLWAGSADGLVHVTKDHGAHWTLVTPPQLPQWAQISSIEPSYTEKGTAYLTASRYMWDDYHPYVYQTSDYGAHWSALTDGLPADQYVFAVRQDPREPRLLFVGTRSSVYVSLNGGAQWQPLTLNLPGVQVRDLAIDVREGELVAATHGRSFWILDNIALLEQLARQSAYSANDLQLFAPQNAWITQAYGGPSEPNGPYGVNPRYGAAIFFNLPSNYNGTTPLTLSFVTAAGAAVRSFTLHPKNKHEKKLTPEQEEQLDAAQQRRRDVSDLTTVEAGMNLFQWDLRYEPAYDSPGFNISETDDFPDTGDGPTAVPGEYRAVLQYGAKQLTAPLIITLDPRVHPAAGALEARLQLETQARDSIDRLDRAIAAAMAARAKLPPARAAQVSDEIGALVSQNYHSSEADVLLESKLRDQLGFLLNSLEAAYDRPTAAQYATFSDLDAMASAGEARLQSLTAP